MFRVSRFAAMPRKSFGGVQFNGVIDFNYWNNRSVETNHVAQDRPVAIIKRLITISKDDPAMKPIDALRASLLKQV